ncbi:MAG TPA: sugar phosphate isomerase/epimerase family protein [Roseiflexaceae bacterium]|nr:sugar phosphate isomerase/epimerase family protein [Roseiflexaceae bacterium]HMP41662.1 sugar phosphate isomerase/epimerase family protein [Roseiflexaceae bacterium]
MHVGILTAPIKRTPLSEIIPWAAGIGVRALEVDVTGASAFPLSADDALVAQTRELLAQHQVRISSLACYVKLTGGSAEQDAQARAMVEQAIRLAARLEVGVVCTIGGFPVGNKSKEQTITEDAPAAFRPLLDLAGAHGIKIALENWFATNMQHLDHWRAMFDAVPDAHFGLNFDPSHLDWPGIDPIGAVEEFRDRIFHVHAKDVLVDHARLARVGSIGEGWWRYTLPGYGRIRWGEFITALRDIGYNDVLSIEHEDRAFPAEEGFERAARFLNTLV